MTMLKLNFLRLATEKSYFYTSCENEEGNLGFDSSSGSGKAILDSIAPNIVRTTVSIK